MIRKSNLQKCHHFTVSDWNISFLLFTTSYVLIIITEYVLIIITEYVLYALWQKQSNIFNAIIGGAFNGRNG